MEELIVYTGSLCSRDASSYKMCNVLVLTDHHTRNSSRGLLILHPSFFHFADITISFMSYCGNNNKEKLDISFTDYSHVDIEFM